MLLDGEIYPIGLHVMTIETCPETKKLLCTRLIVVTEERPGTLINYSGYE